MTICTLCPRPLRRNDALPFGKGKAHVMCVAKLQAQRVIPIETVRARIRPASEKRKGECPWKN